MSPPFNPASSSVGTLVNWGASFALELALGSRLPTIDALQKRHEVTRTAVRQALQLLAADSLISNEQGRGTFVIYAGRPFTEGVNASIDQIIVSWLS